MSQEEEVALGQEEIDIEIAEVREEDETERNEEKEVTEEVFLLFSKPLLKMPFYVIMCFHF